MKKVRFVTYDQNELGHSSVHDIKEFSLSEDPKLRRRKLIREYGILLAGVERGEIFSISTEFE